MMRRTVRRTWRRGRRVRGWSRTTLLRLRLVWGLRLPNEPVLMGIERTVGENLGVIRVHVPHLGVELVVCRSVLTWWRRVAIAARTSVGLSAAMEAWESVLRERGLRLWLSEPMGLGRLRDPGKLEAVLCRALVMEVLGRRGRVRRR